MRILSLCDHSGIMLKPWAEAGHECVAVDLDVEEGVRDGVHHLRANVRDPYRPWNWYSTDRNDKWDIIFCWPPCTNFSGSGARWWASKGLGPYIKSLQLVERCLEIARTAPVWMLENPVGRLSQTLGEPSFTFHPWEYAGYLHDDRDHQSKRTCIWASDNFREPQRKAFYNFIDYDGVEAVEPRQDVWRMAPSDERARLRSLTPEGFARAVYEANA